MKNIILLLMLSTLSSCSGKIPEKNGLEGKLLPSFNLLLMDSTTNFNTSNIPSGKPIVLLFLSPYCPYCRALTEDIVTNMKSLTDIQFYIFSNFPFRDLQEYYIHYQLNKYPNILVGRDFSSHFGTYFKAAGVPYMVIYDKDKRFKQVLIGKVSSTVIKDIALK